MLVKAQSVTAVEELLVFVANLDVTMSVPLGIMLAVSFHSSPFIFPDVDFTFPPFIITEYNLSMFLSFEPITSNPIVIWSSSEIPLVAARPLPSKIPITSYPITGWLEVILRIDIFKGMASPSVVSMFAVLIK